MAQLKATTVNGQLDVTQDVQVTQNVIVTGSNTYVSASEFRGINFSGSSAVFGNATLDAAHVKGNMVVSGNLEVRGDLVTVSESQLKVADKYIEIADGATTAEQIDGAGIQFGTSSLGVSITYDSTSDSFVFSKPIDATAEKVANKLTIAQSPYITEAAAAAIEYDGSEAKTITLDLSSISSSIATEMERAKGVETNILASASAYSASLSADLVALSSSIASDSSDLETKIDNVYASHSALSQSVDTFIGTTYAADSASFDSRINAVDTKADNVLASASAYSASLSSDLTTLSSSVANINTNVTNLSSSVATTTLGLSESIATEASRSEAAETVLSESIATEASRSQAAETALSESIATEASRSQAAETTISASVATEVSRAIAAETALSESIAVIEGGGSNYLSRVSSDASNKMEVALKMDGNKINLADGVNIFYDATNQVISFEFEE